MKATYLFGAVTELRIASRRVDGTLGPYTTIWHAPLGGSVYVRSAHGPDNGWFSRALSSGVGRISAGGVERCVSFELADPAIGAELSRTMHDRYDRYDRFDRYDRYDRFGPEPVGAITGADIAETTIRIVPFDSEP